MRSADELREFDFGVALHEQRDEIADGSPVEPGILFTHNSVDLAWPSIGCADLRAGS
jgi:hypothetical protein